MKNRYSSRQIYIVFLLLLLALSIFILGASALVGDSPDLIVSDGNGYYAWVRSLLIDGDINFENDFQELYYPESVPPDLLKRTPKGLVHNKYPIGVAMIEVPGFLIGHCVAKITPFAVDGISLPYQITVTLSIVAVILLSFYLFFLALRNYGINSEIAVFFSAMVLVNTNLLHYLAKEPVMAHGVGVASINLLVFMASQRTKLIKNQSLFSFLFGLLMGLMMLIRNTNIFLIPFFLLLLRHKIKRKLDVFLMAVGTSLMLFLQPLSLYLLWGYPVFNPYGSKNFLDGFTGMFSAFFGDAYGVFWYHPWYLVLMILNIMGLLLLKHQRLLNLTIIIVFVSLGLINGLWEYSGDSFGQRACIEMLIPLSFGAALTIQNIPSQRYRQIQLPGLMLAGILMLSNVYLWGGYLLQQYPHNSIRTVAQAYTWIMR